VKQVVLQQPTDPLANPFNDPMPRSPFNGAAPQPAPTEITEPQDSPAPGPSDTATNQQPPPANPFSTDPSEPPTTQEPGRLPNSDAIAPSARDSGFGAQLEPPVESDLPAPDPKRDCQDALRNLRANQLTLARSHTILDLRPQEKGEMPYECTLGGERLAIDSGRSWPQTCYTWKASGLCHKPLYFEQPHMERHGHSWGPVIDPVISGAHFFASVPLLPYHMGLQPPCECVYPLGHYRPGSCAPRYIEPWPWSIRGTALQAAAVTGLVFAVP
jgi:hypothetical protein